MEALPKDHDIRAWIKALGDMLQKRDESGKRAAAHTVYRFLSHVCEGLGPLPQSTKQVAEVVDSSQLPSSEHKKTTNAVPTLPHTSSTNVPATGTPPASQATQASSESLSTTPTASRTHEVEQGGNTRSHKRVKASGHDHHATTGPGSSAPQPSLSQRVSSPSKIRNGTSTAQRKKGKQLAPIVFGATTQYTIREVARLRDDFVQQIRSKGSTQKTQEVPSLGKRKRNSTATVSRSSSPADPNSSLEHADVEPFSENEATDIANFFFNEVVGPKCLKRLCSFVHSQQLEVDGVDTSAGIRAARLAEDKDRDLPPDIVGFLRCFAQSEHSSRSNATFWAVSQHLHQLELLEKFNKLTLLAQQNDPPLVAFLESQGLKTSQGKSWKHVITTYLCQELGLHDHTALSYTCQKAAGLSQLTSYFGQGILVCLPRGTATKLNRFKVKRMARIYPIIHKSLKPFQPLFDFCKEHLLLPMQEGRPLAFTIKYPEHSDPTSIIEVLWQSVQGRQVVKSRIRDVTEEEDAGRSQSPQGKASTALSSDQQSLPPTQRNSTPL